MARRAGCGVAAIGGVIDGCYAAYTTSVTFGDSFSSRRSLCAFGAVDNNSVYYLRLYFKFENNATFIDLLGKICYDKQNSIKERNNYEENHPA